MFLVVVVIIGFNLSAAHAQPKSDAQANDAAAGETNKENAGGVSLDDDTLPLTDAERREGVWEDHEAARLSIARGTLSVCENAMLPISFVPVAGQIIASVIEWFCVGPAILGVDYVETFHGRRETQVWQSGLALLAMKAVRDVVRLSSWVGVLVVASVIFATVFPAIVVFPVLASFTFLLGMVAVGASYVLLGLLQDSGSEWAFETVFDAVAGDLTPQTRQQLREESIVKIPLDPPARFFRNMAIVAGTEPAFSWWHVTPVYGPWLKARDRGDALKAQVQAFVRDEPETMHLDVEAIHSTVDTFAAIGGWAGAVGQATALAGASLYLVDRSFFIGDPGNIDASPGQWYGVIGAGLLVVAGGAFAVQVGTRMTRMVWIPTTISLTGDRPQPPTKIDAE